MNEQSPEEQLARAARRKPIVIALGAFLVFSIAFVAYGMRAREVVLLGHGASVQATLEGEEIRFRPTTYGTRLSLSPGTYELVTTDDGLRDSIEVPFFSVLSDMVVSTVSEEQCVLVASPLGVYGEGAEGGFFVDPYQRAMHDAEVSALHNELVMHPCRLPVTIDLLSDHLAVALSVPCSEVPESTEEAEAMFLAAYEECELGRSRE